MRGSIGRVIEAWTSGGWTRLTSASDDPLPAAVQIVYRPPSLRERMPVVRGYRRTVVVIDAPVPSAETLAEWQGSLARLQRRGGWRDLIAEQVPTKTPVWFALLLVVVTLVGLVAMMAIGVSLEMDDRAWTLVVIPLDQLQEDAVEAVAVGQVLMGDAPVLVAGLHDDGSLVLADIASGGGLKDADWRHLRQDLKTSLAPINLRAVSLEGS